MNSKKQSPVLVFENIDGVDVLKTEYISNETIPETLNGESGFHVFHVRMLTELILHQLRRVKPELGLDDETIASISVASSLHDIGKSKIPQSILDFPGRLSPSEFDIVKKHSAFGEDIISRAESDVDPVTLKHAKDIARSHHERIDGTGYPDGLEGDKIPVSAQAVSLADAFDALTSVRSYKDELSQDVAIEMISNGMCGVFDPVLVDCLLHVVNDKVLTDIRDRVKRAGSVISDPTVFIPKKVLFVGNVGYVTEEMVETAFGLAEVVIAGESKLTQRRGLKIFNMAEPPIRAILETYDFDVIVYLAGDLTYDSYLASDSEELREVLRYSSESQKDIKLLYFSALDAAFEGQNDRGVLAQGSERLCEYYAKSRGLDVKIIRIPYLYSGTEENDWLYMLFDKMDKSDKVVINELPSSKCYFLSTGDLAELISRLVDNWTTGKGILTINDEFGITFSDLCTFLAGLKSGTTFDFTGENTAKELVTNNRAVRNQYGWFSKISVLEELEAEYENYKLSRKAKSDTLLDKLRAWLERHGTVIKTLELIVMFLLSELLTHITDSSIYFSIVDFRTVFIVIMATVHGLSWGLAASGLASLAWFFAKLASGTKWLTIFYEPSNWLAFVFYFLVGSVCGYVRLKNDDKIKFTSEQNDLLEEKLVFTRELYDDTYREKRDLKKQIIGSKDSFGKIFDITRKLDTVEPRKLYLKIMETFEDVLENKSISVYSVNAESRFGRLEVASRDISADLSKSISLDTYASVLERVSEGEIWRNTELDPKLPSYAAGVSRAGKIELLIFIWNVGVDQRSLYYANLFKILCDLVQISLLRALDYNQAMLEKRYIEGTRVMKAEEFAVVLEDFNNMAQKKVFSFVALDIDCKGHSFAEADAILGRRIRANDILGDGGDGHLKLLLSQATESDLAVILPRFEGLDIDLTVI